MDRSFLFALFHLALVVVPFLSAALAGWLRGAGSYSARLLNHLIFVAVGIQGTAAGLQQIFRGEAVAAYLNWPSSPFLGELGIANFSFGLLGLAAPWASRGWKRAAALGYGFFLAAAAYGPVDDALVNGNWSIGNVGPTLWADILIPILFVILFLRGADGAEKDRGTPA